MGGTADNLDGLDWPRNQDKVTEQDMGDMANAKLRSMHRVDAE